MKFTRLFSLFAFIALAVLAVGTVSAVSLASWPLTTNGVASSVNSNVSAGDFVFGSTLSSTGFAATGTSAGASASNWTTSQQADSNKHFQISISPNTGFNLTITKLNFSESRSSTGIRNYSIQWSKSSNFNNPTILSDVLVPDNTLERDGSISNLNIFVNQGETLYVRWFGYGTENNATGIWRINENTLNLEGTIAQIIVPPTASNLTLTAPTSPVAVGQNATLTITNTGGQTLTNIVMSETTSPSLGLSFVPLTISSLTQGSSTTVQALTTGLGTLKFGLHTAQVRAQVSSSGQSATASFQIKKTFCSAGETPTSNVSITNVAWSNDGEGDDNNWEYLDEIELEVDIKNNDNDDEVDAVAKLGLYDSSGKNVADDLIFLEDSDSDDEEIEITIDDDDEETVTWVFKVPADFDKGNYKLAVKVYDEDAGESNSCRDSSSDFDNVFFQSIQVKEATDEGRFVVIDEISLDDQVSCGQTLNGQFTLFNIGDEDQDRVKVLIKNDALNIDEEVELTTDLDQGEDETLEFTIRIPATASNGNYGLEFTTFYDYRNGVYREESEETFDAFIELIGCSQPLGNTGSGSLTDTVITAELDSEARAGEQLIIKATITNSGIESKAYTISARDYDDWATLDDISDTSFTLDADESKEITLTFTVDEDAEGTQTFDIQAASEGRIQVQEVEVELETAKRKFSFDFKDNSFIWIIGLVNLVLIILIIVVAVRLAKR